MAFWISRIFEKAEIEQPSLDIYENLEYFVNYYENSTFTQMFVLLFNFLCYMDHKIMKIIDLDPFQPLIVSLWPFFRALGVKNSHISGKNRTKIWFCT